MVSWISVDNILPKATSLRSDRLDWRPFSDEKYITYQFRLVKGEVRHLVSMGNVFKQDRPEKMLTDFYEQSIVHALT